MIRWATGTKPDGSKIEFATTCRIDTPVEVDYYQIMSPNYDPLPLRSV